MSLPSSFKSLQIPEAMVGSLMEPWFPLDEKEVITFATDDKDPVLSEKRKKPKARTANKVGYRDLVMSTDGISLNIVQNAKSVELTKGDFKRPGINLNEGGIQKPEKTNWRCTLNS